MHEFDIYFRGEIMTGADPASVRREVAQLFKVQEDTVDRLFSGKPLRVKKAVDADTASRYRAAFREVGALIQIVPAGAPPPAPVAPTEVSSPPPTQAPAEPADEVTTIVIEAPADTAPPSSPAAAFTLAEPGATIDPSPPAPPAEIDTSRLEALPPNTGSLEDCREDKVPHPIPDISHMRLVDD